MTPEPETTAAPRRLTRSTQDRKVAGVAGGIAEHFDLDPGLVRVGFMALTVFGGSGLLLYLLLAILLPSADAPPDGEQQDRTRKIVMIALVVAAVLSLPFTGPGFIFAGPGFVTLAVLGAIGILVWQAAGGQGVDASLSRAAVIVLACAAAAVAGIGAAAAAAFGAGTAMAVGVIAVGVALVVGGVLGGARWLIAPALLLAVPLAIVSAADIDLRGGVGQRDYRPATLSEVKSSYRLGAGEMRLDLSDVEFPAGRTALKLDMGAGHAVVDVPSGVCVQSDTHIGAGEANILGHVNDGVDVNVSRRPLAGDAPVLFIDTDIGMGQLEVQGREGCA